MNDKQKAARDVRRLQAAGFRFTSGMWFRESPFILGQSWFAKPEAIAILDREEKKQPKEKM